jgi:hypothetical protein
MNQGLKDPAHLTGRKRPGWQSSMLSLGTLVMMATLAAGITLIIWRELIWHGLSPSFALCALFPIFVVLTSALYVVWMWVFFEHPAKIAKKLPISGKELRRKKKQFFDNLPK